MELIGTNREQMIYIRSEDAFNQARFRGVWDMARSLITHSDPYSPTLDSLKNQLGTVPHTYLGLQDIEIDQIAGSLTRQRDFTRHFAPWQIGHARGKDCWRSTYTAAMTGSGFRPIGVYKIGNSYIVQDGHCRISVAKYLGWKTMQAFVTELPQSIMDEPRTESADGQRRAQMALNLY